MAPTGESIKTRRGRHPIVHVGHGAAWLFGVPLVLLLVLYVALRIGPVPLPFVAGQARSAVLATLPDSFQLELGDTALALENGVRPVIRFAPVVLTDRKSGAAVKMEALEVGFSPFRVLLGQPGANVTLIKPQIQIVQDLRGPRLASFEVVEGDDGGRATIHLRAGDSGARDSGPQGDTVAVSPIVATSQGVTLRSDNDWMVVSFESGEAALHELERNAEQGRFSRLTIRGGTIELHDQVFGLLRDFSGISMDVLARASGREIEGSFAADIGGRRMSWSFTRTVRDNSDAGLSVDGQKVDLAVLLPFINDVDSLLALEGASSVSANVTFDGDSHALKAGTFGADLNGMKLRIKNDLFPVFAGPVEIEWDPGTGQFDLKDVAVTIGKSRGNLSGVFVMGVDASYGPTVSMRVKGREVSLHPYDLAAPHSAFETMNFDGWTAPLFGAVGIDRFVAAKPGSEIWARGRVDLLTRGMGLKLEVGGSDLSIDDAKRIWPHVIANSARQWFVENYFDGTINTGALYFDFPVGSIPIDGADMKIPKGSMKIDIAGSGAVLRPMEGWDPVSVAGINSVSIRDNHLTMGIDGAALMTAAGGLQMLNGAVVIEEFDSDVPVMEFSGDVTGTIPALVALAKARAPEALGRGQIPIDATKLAGAFETSVISTLQLNRLFKVQKLDYAASGAVRDLATTEPIDGHTIADGQLSFTASQDSYRASGSMIMDSVKTEVVLEGVTGDEGGFVATAAIDIGGLKSLGFDLSRYLEGTARVNIATEADGTLTLAADLTDVQFTLDVLGMGKAKGVAATLEAVVKQTGTLTNITDIKLAFGDVRVEGGLDFDTEKGLVSAEFPTFVLTEGDSAQVSVAPASSGYDIAVRGSQMDLRPMLKRHFNATGLAAAEEGPDTEGLAEQIRLDLKLDRAIGFYRTTAYGLEFALTVRGKDLFNVNATARFDEQKSMAVTTNQVSGGRQMSVAFNDAGVLLRFTGLYSRLLGGAGSLVLTTDLSSKVDAGELRIGSFALVDEDKVAEVINAHRGSQKLIERGNRVSFRNGRMGFVMSPGQIEFTEAVLSGDTVGGTMRGFIDTKAEQYHLVGTYVPLFGLNNIFQRLPLLGPLLGGREGEGLIGVTFAVTGPLDKPDFRVNPASILAPGVFRKLFEFRAERPQASAAGQ